MFKIEMKEASCNISYFVCLLHNRWNGPRLVEIERDSVHHHLCGYLYLCLYLCNYLPIKTELIVGY